jgi:hypothetical protein
MKYVDEMTSGGMIYIIGSGVQAILRVLSQQFDRLQCWYYMWEGFMR